jgi:hypothetical protein
MVVVVSDSGTFPWRSAAETVPDCSDGLTSIFTRVIAPMA